MFSLAGGDHGLTYFNVMGENVWDVPQNSHFCCKLTFSHLFNQTDAAVKGFDRGSSNPKSFKIGSSSRWILANHKNPLKWSGCFMWVPNRGTCEVILWARRVWRFEERKTEPENQSQAWQWMWFGPESKMAVSVYSTSVTSDKVTQDDMLGQWASAVESDKGLTVVCRSCLLSVYGHDVPWLHCFEESEISS